MSFRCISCWFALCVSVACCIDQYEAAGHAQPRRRLRRCALSVSQGFKPYTLTLINTNNALNPKPSASKITRTKTPVATNLHNTPRRRHAKMAGKRDAAAAAIPGAAPGGVDPDDVERKSSVVLIKKGFAAAAVGRAMGNAPASAAWAYTRFPFPLNLSLPCPFPLNLRLLSPPYISQMNPWMRPDGAQVELSRERCVPKVLKLSSEVDECKPLLGGRYLAVVQRAEAAARGGRPSTHCPPRPRPSTRFVKPSLVLRFNDVP
jgi:hypothetical protein